MLINTKRGDVMCQCQTASKEEGRTPRADEVTCLETDIGNAPYIGRMAYCNFQRHLGGHSWANDARVPRHPDDQSQHL